MCYTFPFSFLRRQNIYSLTTLTDVSSPPSLIGGFLHMFYSLFSLRMGLVRAGRHTKNGAERASAAEKGKKSDQVLTCLSRYSFFSFFLFFYTSSLLLTVFFFFHFSHNSKRVSPDYILLRTGGLVRCWSRLLLFSIPPIFRGVRLGTGFPREGFVTITHILIGYHFPTL